MTLAIHILMALVHKITVQNFKLIKPNIQLQEYHKPQPAYKLNFLY